MQATFRKKDTIPSQGSLAEQEMTEKGSSTWSFVEINSAIAGLALAELQQLSVCEQLGAMVKAWRCLKPDTGRHYR